jgi:hypothetical protein
MSRPPIPIHVTEVQRWLECAHREAQYQDGSWQRTTSVPRLRGTAVHAAREESLRHFKDTGTLLDYGRALDAGYAKMDEAAEREPLDAGTLDDARSEAAPYIEADAVGILPALAPHVEALEETMTLPLVSSALRESYELVGRIDVLARDPITRGIVEYDLKTGTKKLSQAALNCSTQRTGYGVLIRATRGTMPRHAIDAVRILKTKPRTVTEATKVIPLPVYGGVAVSDAMTTERTDADHQAFLRRVAWVLESREAGKHAPASVGMVSPCERCNHRGHPDPAQRCGWINSWRGGEGGEDA